MCPFYKAGWQLRYHFKFGPKYQLELLEPCSFSLPSVKNATIKGLTQAWPRFEISTSRNVQTRYQYEIEIELLSRRSTVEVRDKLASSNLDAPPAPSSRVGFFILFLTTFGSPPRTFIALPPCFLHGGSFFHCWLPCPFTFCMGRVIFFAVLAYPLPFVYFINLFPAPSHFVRVVKL